MSKTVGRKKTQLKERERGKELSLKCDPINFQVNYLGNINFLKFFILQQKYFETESETVRDFKVKTKEERMALASEVTSLKRMGG